MNHFKLTASTGLLAILLLASPVIAGTLIEQAPPVEQVAPEPWIKPTADIRARYEYGIQDGRSVSHAATIRGRFGLLTREFSGFQFFGEYEGTLPADRDSYQAASVHGAGQNKTVIADPASNELNRLWGSFAAFDSKAKAGRQRIILDNARYVGNVGWRQNEQTYDAARLDINHFENLTLTYGYFNRVNRIFGSGTIANPAQRDFTGNSHFIRIAADQLPFGVLTAHAYFFDLHSDAGDANSNNSFGLTLAGPLFCDPLSYYLEYGYQTDAFDSPLDYNAHYGHAIIKTAIGEKSSFSAGYEYLGSDNGVGYKFPLATLHKFNGFADKFIATPADGLQDIYAVASTKLPLDIGFSVFYHKFYNHTGGTDYGNEFDAVMTKDLGNGFSLLGKYAYYWAADGPYTDTNRISVEIDFKY